MSSSKPGSKDFCPARIRNALQSSLDENSLLECSSSIKNLLLPFFQAAYDCKLLSALSATKPNSDNEILEEVEYEYDYVTEEDTDPEPDSEVDDASVSFADITPREVSTPMEPRTVCLQTDVSKIPRDQLFLAYLPPSWFFHSFAEMVLACLRFYHSPVSYEFIEQSTKNVELINQSKNSADKAHKVTTTWRKYIKSALEKYSPWLIYHNPVDKTFRLTRRGKEALTSIGANHSSIEGLEFVKKFSKNRKVIYPERHLPSNFVYQTVYDFLNEEPPIEPPTPERKPREKKARKKEVKVEQTPEGHKDDVKTTSVKKQSIKVKSEVLLSTSAASIKRSCLRLRRSSEVKPTCLSPTPVPALKRPRRCTRNKDTPSVENKKEPEVLIKDQCFDRVFDVPFIKKFLRDLEPCFLEELNRFLPKVDSVLSDGGQQLLFKANRYLKLTMKDLPESFFNNIIDKVNRSQDENDPEVEL
ncbi:hypothetical protein P9112_003016 [Eukaryota sp. TZLM1-RC]